MGTILVTGRNGFIANELVQALKRDHKIISLVRSRKPHLDYSQEELIIADLLYLSAEQFKHYKIDLIIHAAAMIQGVPSMLEENNIQSSKNVFKIAEFYNIPVIFFSSINVLFVDYLGSYARSKKNCEEMLQRSKLKYLIIRVPFVLGKNSPTVKTIKDFYIKFSFFPLFGPQRGKTHLISISTVVDFIVDKIKQKNFSQEIVNLIGRQFYIYPEVIENVLKRKVRFVTMPYVISLKLCQLFEFLRLPFPIYSEQVKSLNLDKVIDGDFNGRAIFVDDDKKILFD